ncbi:MAG: methionyl-tRNA formyltransferase [Thermodesulfobacteriota bacterium]
MMRVALIGRHQALHAAGLAAMERGHRIACVVTAKSRPEYLKHEEDFRDLARAAGCPFFYLPDFRDPALRQTLDGLDAAISMNWVGILGAEALGLFRTGVLNAHYGPLPRYRGNACPNWAILAGEESIHLCVHLMEPGELDCGRVIREDSIRVTPQTYISDIYDWGDRVIPALFAEALDQLDADPGFCLRMASPDDPAAFRCHPRIPEDARIDWSRPSSEIHRLVRASSDPLPGAYTYFMSGGALSRLYVLRAREGGRAGLDLAVPGQVTARGRDGSLKVRCGDGSLALELCRVDNGEPFAPASRFMSSRFRLGVDPLDALYLLGGS